jgi:alanine racemase
VTDFRPTRAVIDLDAVRHNVRTLLATAGRAQLCVVVKANGYGHGAVPVAVAALEAGATHLAISSVKEGRELRHAGIASPILLFSEPPTPAIGEVADLRLTPPLYTEAFAAAYAEEGWRRGIDLPVHLAFDTGMGRVGVEPARWSSFLDHLAPLLGSGIEVTGTWSHLARADEPDDDATARQLDGFAEVRALLADRGIGPGIVHIANSAGTLLHDDARGDRVGMVRAGIAVYGLSPDVTHVDAVAHGLRPALSLTTAVAFVKPVSEATPISYGHRWCAPSDGWIATLPIGYADGVPRRLTGEFELLIGGRRRPVVGTVTMDMIHVWFDDAPPALGDEAVLIGRQGTEQIRIEDWARTVGTITYEITCQLTSRVPRVHLN